jgi:hypothetical protein
MQISYSPYFRLCKRIFFVFENGTFWLCCITCSMSILGDSSDFQKYARIKVFHRKGPLPANADKGPAAELVQRLSHLEISRASCRCCHRRRRRRSFACYLLGVCNGAVCAHAEKSYPIHSHVEYGNNYKNTLTLRSGYSNANIIYEQSVPGPACGRGGLVGYAGSTHYFHLFPRLRMTAPPYMQRPSHLSTSMLASSWG